jgi:hypothetical protein
MTINAIAVRVLDFAVRFRTLLGVIVGSGSAATAVLVHLGLPAHVASEVLTAAGFLVADFDEVRAVFSSASPAAPVAPAK